MSTRSKLRSALTRSSAARVARGAGKALARLRNTWPINDKGLRGQSNVGKAAKQITQQSNHNAQSALLQCLLRRQLVLLLAGKVVA